MGILPSSAKDTKATPGAKRRSTQLDFSNLGSLKKEGTVGFSAFRDHETERRKSRKKTNGAMDEDSEDEDEDSNPLSKMEQEYDTKVDTTRLGPEDAEIQAELKAGIDRIRVSASHTKS